MIISPGVCISFFCVFHIFSHLSLCLLFPFLLGCMKKRPAGVVCCNQVEIFPSNPTGKIPIISRTHLTTLLPMDQEKLGDDTEQHRPVAQSSIISFYLSLSIFLSLCVLFCSLFFLFHSDQHAHLCHHIQVHLSDHVHLPTLSVNRPVSFHCGRWQ